jgi:hypothetical protein
MHGYVGSTSSCPVLLASEMSGLRRKVHLRWRPAGDAQGGGSPLVGGAASMMRASGFGWRAACLRRGGNPPAPAFPRRGKRERGNQIPRCRRPFCRPVPERRGDSEFPSCSLTFISQSPVSGSAPPECVRPTVSESGSGPLSNSESCPTWQSRCAAPGTAVSWRLPHPEMNPAS